MWLAPVLIAGAAFGLDRLVETDMEKIRTVIFTAAKAVEEEKCEAIEGLISENYSDSFHKTRKQLMRHCKGVLSGPFVEKNVARIASIEESSPKATVIFTVRVIFDKQSYLYQMYKQEIFAKLEADLEKQADGRWLMCRVEILEIDRMPAQWNAVMQ